MGLNLAGALQAEFLAAASGVQLPADFISEATAAGLRKSALQAYIALQVLLSPFQTLFRPCALPTNYQW